MNRCEQYEPYLAALADDQADALPAEIRKDLLEHVAACPACQADIARQRQMARLLARPLPQPFPPTAGSRPGTPSTAQTTSRTRSLPTALRRPQRWAAAGASAAVAAMILLAVLLWPTSPRPPQPSSSLPLQPARIVIYRCWRPTPRRDSMVITSGQEDVVVVWIVQDADEDTHT